MTSYQSAGFGADRGGASTPSMVHHLASPWAEGPLSLEERLRIVRERCRLLADMFSIHAEATFLACHVSMSADAYNALTDMCRSSADDLERLAQDIPGAIANWCPGLEGAATGLEGDEWDRCKNPVDGDGPP